ncbi:hypothetical protein GV829_04480 [Sphingomonas lacunae]|uniref:Uncharacterized protein n=1 Tax=Sphingomonas lacunae TaxID=2698828 RepID=A0A6M4AXU1_9SPHN|nr:hypothetical protein [Sphingomonas lacunae]QJQ31791.1 hypothetical protein GV829_04480 [Sphingomonas lacunae]
MTDFSYDTSLSAANAPAGRTCPHCSNRVAAPELNGAGGDFWRCTATPVLPAFGGFWLRYPEGMPMNIALFDPASSYAAALNARACPLFTPRAES